MFVLCTNIISSLDIDECKEVNDCEKAEYCINTIGAYYCKCPEGYHGNGTLTDRCISNTKAYWLIPVLATAGTSKNYNLDFHKYFLNFFEDYLLKIKQPFGDSQIMEQHFDYSTIKQPLYPLILNRSSRPVA